MRVFILISILVITLGSCDQKKANSNQQDDKAVSSIDSISLITNQIANDSSNYKLFLKRAYLNLEEGKIDPAFRDVNTALDLEPKAPETFMLLSDLYFILGNVDNAISALRKAAELDPSDEQAYIKLAETYLIIKNYSMAQKSAEMALSINIDNDQAYFLKGIAFLEQGDTTIAITNFRIAANLDTANYEALMQLGSLYQNAGDTIAFKYYFSAFNARPDDEFVLFSIARYYQELGKYEDALIYYEKVNEIYPQNKYAFFNKAYILLVENEDFENAEIAFQQAINIDPSYVEAVYNLGRTYEAKGLYTEAAIKYRQALELYPNYPLAIDGLNRMNH